jgi:DHA3 family tetracycline resistance protein-like MFS transporter
MIGLDALQLVLVGTVLEASAFLFEIPTGVVADLRGRKLSVILGYAMIGAGFLLWGAVPVFVAVLIAQVLWGIGSTFTSGALQAWLSDEVGPGRAGPLFARGAQIAQAAGIVAIGISLAAGLVSLRLPMVVAGLAFLALAVVLVPLMTERKFRGRIAGGKAWTHVAATVRHTKALIGRRPGLLLLLGVSLFLGLHSEGVDRLWTAHLLRDFAVIGRSSLPAAAWFAALALVLRASAFLSTGIAHRIASRWREGTIIAVMGAATAVRVASLLAFALAPTFWPALSAFVGAWAIGAALEPLYEGLVNRETTDSSTRATVFSVAAGANALGQIAVGPAIGIAGRLRSLKLALGLSAGLLIPVVPLLRRLGRRQGREVA